MTDLKLHAFPASPPSRIATLVLDVLGLDYEYVTVNMGKKDHMTPEFRKMNPQHTIPVLEDGDLQLSESRAIALYLVQKYDTNLGLIPNCPKEAAIVYQRLFFEACTLTTTFMALFGQNMFRGKKEKPTEAEKAKLTEAMGWLEDFLKPTGFVAGTDKMTLPDVSILSIYSCMEATKGVYVDLDKYPESKKWAAKMKKLVPNYEKACGEGAKMFGGWFQATTGF